MTWPLFLNGHIKDKTGSGSAAGAASAWARHLALCLQAFAHSKRGSYQIRKTWMNVVDKRAREFTSCPQNLAPMVTQAMRSVAKTARRCWAIPNLRPECEATVLQIPTPMSGRGDRIVLLRPYGGHVACSAQEYGYTGQWEVLRESRRTPALQPPALSGRCCL